LPCRGDPLNVCQRKIKGTEGLLKLTKFGVAVLIFGDIQPQQYLEKQLKYGNLLRLSRLMGDMDDMGGMNSQCVYSI